MRENNPRPRPTSFREAVTGRAGVAPWTVATPSRAADFRECPRRYYDRNVLGLMGEELTDDRQSLGTTVHAVLSLAHSPGSSSCAAAGLADLIAHEGIDEILPLGMPAGVSAGEVADMVRAHSPLCPASETSRHVGSELALFWIDMAPPRVLYQGRVDAVWNAPTGLEVRDYKTGRRPDWPIAGRVDAATYAVLAAATFPGERPVAVTFEYLADGELDRLDLDSDGFARALSIMRKTGQELAGAEEYPARPGPRCEGCSYRSTCPESAGAT